MERKCLKLDFFFFYHFISEIQPEPHNGNERRTLIPCLGPCCINGLFISAGQSNKTYLTGSIFIFLLQHHHCRVTFRMEFLPLLLLSIKNALKGLHISKCKQICTKVKTRVFPNISALTFSQEVGQVTPGSRGKGRHLVASHSTLRYRRRRFLLGSIT